MKDKRKALVSLIITVLTLFTLHVALNDQKPFTSTFEWISTRILLGCGVVLAVPVIFSLMRSIVNGEVAYKLFYTMNYVFLSLYSFFFLFGLAYFGAL